MNILFIIVTIMAAFFLGTFLGNNALKYIYNILGKPFIRTVVSVGNEGMVTIDAQYNSLFIFKLTNLFKDHDVYKNIHGDNEKVAIYLYEVFSDITEEYLPETEEDNEDIDVHVPPLEGNPVKQVVDISKVADQKIKNTNVDIEVG